MQLTANFNDHEFRCKCGNCDGGQIDPQFVGRLQALRDVYNKPMIINSGCRCPEHNAVVGGAKASRHLTEIADRCRLVDAVDVQVSAADMYRFLQLAFLLKFSGIGIYEGRVHIDDRRGEKVCWIG